MGGQFPKTLKGVMSLVYGYKGVRVYKENQLSEHEGGSNWHFDLILLMYFDRTQPRSL